VRILIISDLHANLEAVESLPQEFDQLWVLGDLMNYGPDPSAAVRYVRQHAAMVVRGNHDHAVAFGEDPRCSARFRMMAEETCRYTRSVLAEDDSLFAGTAIQGWLRSRRRPVLALSCGAVEPPV
jgi:protein phosphatase